MDLKVTDAQIIPACWLLRCEPPKPPANPLAPDPVPYPYLGGGYLAYTDQERDAIAAALGKLSIPYVAEPMAQPDPALLAACQGKVHSRSEALAALATGKPPVTLETIAADVEQLKLAKAEPIPKEL